MKTLKVEGMHIEIRKSAIEVRNVEIPGPTQQLLCSKYHNFLAIFALPHSKINQIANFLDDNVRNDLNFLFKP